MANKSGNAYGLTALIPIKNDVEEDTSYASRVREILQNCGVGERSPMAKVPNTYLCRFYMLNDVFYQGSPAEEEHLQSKYIVFSSNFHGELEPYLEGMWNHAQSEIKVLLAYCVAFEQVTNAQQFIGYMKRCQVDNALFYNGSTDDPLKEQLKAIYLKQALSHFVYTHQPLVQSGEMSAEELQKSFKAFVELTQPKNLDGPTWKAGSEHEPEGLREAIAHL